MSCDFGEVSKILLWDTNSSLMYLAILPNSSGSCEVYGGQSGRGTEFSPNTSVSPVSIIPPLLHTHPSIYHPRCTMFFSQHFSFPCQYYSTIAPYSSIHLPPTLYKVFLPALQFSLSVSSHHCSTLIHPSTTHAV